MDAINPGWGTAAGLVVGLILYLWVRHERTQRILAQELARAAAAARRAAPPVVSPVAAVAAETDPDWTDAEWARWAADTDRIGRQHRHLADALHRMGPSVVEATRAMQRMNAEMRRVTTRGTVPGLPPKPPVPWPPAPPGGVIQGTWDGLPAVYDPVRREVRVTHRTGGTVTYADARILTVGSGYRWKPAPTTAPPPPRVPPPRRLITLEDE